MKWMIIIGQQSAINEKNDYYWPIHFNEHLKVFMKYDAWISKSTKRHYSLRNSVAGLYEEKFLRHRTKRLLSHAGRARIYGNIALNSCTADRVQPEKKWNNNKVQQGNVALHSWPLINNLQQRSKADAEIDFCKPAWPGLLTEMCFTWQPSVHSLCNN